MEYAQHIIESTQEIFSSMIMLEATPGQPFERDKSVLTDSISGILGMTGSIKGMLAIHLPNETALAVTTAFLGIDVVDIDEDVRDAVGELANMLGGSIKTILDPAGSDIKLSMPTAIYGQEYSIDCIAEAEGVTVPFALQGKTFLVELQIRRED